MKIVLKHLAREFDMDPFRLRQVLRAWKGYAKGRRWQWDDSKKAEKKELEDIRTYLRSRKSTKKSNDSPSASTVDDTGSEPKTPTVDRGQPVGSSSVSVELRRHNKESETFIANTVARINRAGGSRKSGGSTNRKTRKG